MNSLMDENARKFNSPLYSQSPKFLHQSNKQAEIVKNEKIWSIPHFNPKGNEQEQFQQQQENPIIVCGTSVTRPNVHIHDVVRDRDSGKMVAYFSRTQNKIITIKGQDKRRRIEDPTSFPWSAHCHLLIQFRDNSLWFASGTLINSRHVLTAGHNLHDKDLGGWAKSIIVYPGRNEDEQLFGSFESKMFCSVSGWVIDKNSDWDYGMIILDTDVGKNTGWLGLATQTDDLLKQRIVNVTGFPREKGGLQMWTCYGSITHVEEQTFEYEIESTEGGSGEAIWEILEEFPGYHLVGMYAYKHDIWPWGNHWNGATRISKAKFQRILECIGGFSEQSQ